MKQIKFLLILFIMFAIGQTAWSQFSGGTGTSDNPYKIATAADWNTLATNVNNGTSTYSGVYFKMTDDIGTPQYPITSSIGVDATKSFQGTFDGDGHTLTVNLGADSYMAPFRRIKETVTIKNLKVAGNVAGNGYNGGLVGYINGGTVTIRNCMVSANVSTTGTYMSGVIAHAGNSALTLIIDGCVFNGTLTSNSTGDGSKVAAGFISWYNADKTITMTLTMNNCLFAGTFTDNGSGGVATFYPLGAKKAASVVDTVSSSNNYYTQVPVSTTGNRVVISGKHAYSITPAANVTVANAGAVTATYNVSSITVYNKGLKCNNVLYAARADKLSLNLTNAVGNSYAVSSGTLSGSSNPYSLTMPAANVTIYPTITVTFNSNGGSTVASQEVRVGNTASTPTNPTRSGYTFLYWILNGVEFDFSTPITSPTTLLAYWANGSTVLSENCENVNWDEWSTGTNQSAIWTTGNGDGHGGPGPHSGNNTFTANNGIGWTWLNSPIVYLYGNYESISISGWFYNRYENDGFSVDYWVDDGVWKDPVLDTWQTHNNWTRFTATITIPTKGYIEYVRFRFNATLAGEDHGIALDDILVTAMPSTQHSYPYDVTGAGTGSEKWYLIASPVAENVTPATENGFVRADGNYDLYYFDQTEDLEWRNYKQESFFIESGKGYLYANKENATLKFDGTDYAGSGEVALSYSENNASSTMWGWNLIGNPFNATAYLADGRDFYRMNSAGSEIVVADNAAISTMEGIFVKAANAGDNSVTFTTSSPSKGRASNQSLVMNVMGSDNNVIDRAIVRFGDGATLSKLMLNENNTKIYIPQADGDYAVVSSDGKGSIPVNFKASKMGRYTISVETSCLNIKYLHLIDNITGNDIDLLQDNSYSFIASPKDIEERFSLSLGDTDSNDTFAFQNGSDIIVNGNGELQVFDLMGRLVSTQHVYGGGTLYTSSLPTGVYIFRLNEKSQKIVVR